MTTQTPNQSRPIKWITPSMVLVLCKVLCNVLGGTENDKSLVSTAATFSDNLPPTLRKQQHKATTCVGLLQSLAEVRIEDHLLVFFRIWQPAVGQSAINTCMIPMPFHDLSILGF